MSYIRYDSGLDCLRHRVCGNLCLNLLYGNALLLIDRSLTDSWRARDRGYFGHDPGL